MIKIRLTIILSLIAWATNAKIRIVGVDPINKLVILQNFYSTTIDLSKYMLSFQEYDTNISKLNIILGNIMCPAKGKVTIGNIDMGYDSGYIALHDLRNTGDINHKQSMGDFVQWGSAGHRWEQKADSTYYTKYDSIKAQFDTIYYWHQGDYLKTAPPYNFTGGSPDRGVQFWQSYKLPLFGIKFIYVHPDRNEFALKNTGASSLDISMLYICSNNGCSDSIKYLNVIKGSVTNLAKNDTVWLNGWNLSDSIGSLALYFPLNKRDTNNLIDYVQWGGAAQPNCTFAHQKRYWDSTTYIHCNAKDSLIYFGNFSSAQSGVNWWKVGLRTIDTSGNDTTKKDTTNINIPLTKTIYIYIYPNPSHGNFYINTSQLSKAIIYIYNSLGVCIKRIETTANETAIQLEKMGIYTLEVRAENYRLVKSLVVISPD
jgi:hypothetical protein